MTTRRRPAAPLATAATTGLLLLATLLPAGPATAAVSEADPAAAGRPRDLIESAGLGTGGGQVVLEQDARTSERIRLLQHDYEVDTVGDHGTDFFVTYGRGDTSPTVFTAPRYRVVACPRATGETRPGGRTTVVLPVRCLEKRGAKPRNVAARPVVVVKVERRRGTRCFTETGPRLGPLPTDPRPLGRATTFSGRSSAVPARRGC